MQVRPKLNTHLSSGYLLKLSGTVCHLNARSAPDSPLGLPCPRFYRRQVLGEYPRTAFTSDTEPKQRLHLKTAAHLSENYSYFSFIDAQPSENVSRLRFPKIRC